MTKSLMKYEDFVKIGPTLPDGAFSEYDMEVICQALQDIPVKGVYLEVGVMYGRSMAWARMMSKGYVYGIDIKDEFRPKWWENHENWEFINQPSNEAVKNWKKPIDVLFIDGGHWYEAVKDDWDNFSPFVKQGGTVFLHDCDETSPDVVKLFDEIGGGWEKKLYKRPGFNTSMASARKL